MFGLEQRPAIPNVSMGEFFSNIFLMLIAGFILIGIKNKKQFSLIIIKQSMLHYHRLSANQPVVVSADTCYPPVVAFAEIHESNCNYFIPFCKISRHLIYVLYIQQRQQQQQIEMLNAKKIK